ncbi:hypothetical protein [Aerosakkonema funiforme]|uniref:hypothetical protein n=1 Tax=Aerosakkonema funiforme TaxID=1246630 RepID=UPI0035B94F7C
MATQYTIEIDAVKNCSTDGALKTTDIKVKEGQLLIVDVDPTKTWSPRKDERKLLVNANGISALTNNIDSLYKEATIVNWNYESEFALGSLIGTLDNGKSYFPVGTHLSMTILREGNLSFFFWGGDANTNTGAVTATVTVQDASSYYIPKDINNPAGNLDYEGQYFDINARINSLTTGTPLNTGIELEPGDVLKVNVDPKDLWNMAWMDRNGDVNANGINKNGAYPLGYVGDPFSFRIGSLIGTLDEGKTYFPVGTHLEMTVLSKGKLSFVFWDVDKLNNRGFIRTFVKVIKKAAPKPPDPVTISGKIEVPSKSEIGIPFTNTQTKKVTYTFTPSGTWSLTDPKYGSSALTPWGIPGVSVDNLKYPQNTAYALLAVRSSGAVIEVSKETTIDLETGETLTFLVNDNDYKDNVGTLIVDWSANLI